MQPIITQALMTTRIADMRREADAARLAHGLKRGRRARRERAVAPVAPELAGAPQPVCEPARVIQPVSGPARTAQPVSGPARTIQPASEPDHARLGAA